ncbi:(2,3-dihydroxybenzoyl)adenylate synthase [Streptomyces albus]|uniref:(2,3-dihydroxybenzoyl)adenylate synthase n=1 Tax=Streptomyces albus TaxID=1888 RepID=UPI0034572091
MTRPRQEAPPPLPRPSAERAAAYRAQGWWTGQRVDAMVLDPAAAYPDRPALTAPGCRLTYGQLTAAVEGAAVRLGRLGLTRGDTVVVQLPNIGELVVLALALMRLGAHPVMAPPSLRHRELAHVMRIVRPAAMALPRRLERFDHYALARELAEGCPSLHTLLVLDPPADTAGRSGPDTTGQEGPRVADLGALCRPEREDTPPPGHPGPPFDGEPAVFLLSSGTTGPPKPIARDHEGYGYMIRAASEVAGLTSSTVYFAVMSATHGFTLNCPGIWGTLAAGGRVVLDSPQNAEAALDLIDREQVTHSTLVPALVGQWLAAAQRRGRGPTSLRVLQVGGARLEPGPAEEATRVLGCTVQQCYGMSEGLLCYTTLDDPAHVIAETQGRPLSPGDEIRLVDENDKPVPEGSTGSLLTRGPYTVSGYYGDPAATDRAFTEDGFYRTGDVARLHPSGNLVVEGRLDDVINRGGEKISGGELEGLALRHPAVAAAAAVAMPHPVWGQAVCLCVVPARPAAGEADTDDSTRPEPALLDLRRHLAASGLAPYKLPERLEILDALPMIGVGKVNRVALRALVAEHVAAETAARGG